MTQPFSNLEPSKQERILKAAYEEFAEQGYEKASTNRIVRAAGIGKGMLFYYFKSKKELFHYLIEYGINYVLNEYLSQINEDESDFIEKYKQAAEAKMKAQAKNPHVFSFFGTIYIKEEIELPEELEAQLIELKRLGYSKLFTNIDTSLFRGDVAPEKVIKLINWSMQGYETELVNRIKGENLASLDVKPLWDEFYEYLSLLKKIFYK